MTWDEVEAAADGGDLSFEAADVLDRVEEHGDLFAADPRPSSRSSRRRGG